MQSKISRELIKSADGKLTLFDHYRHEATKKIMNDPQWQLEGGSVLGETYENWMDVMNGDDIDAVLKEMEDIRNLQIPLST